MTYDIHFTKERQKFSAAHFTLFANGDVERLHGHNYRVGVCLVGEKLDGGLLFPFGEAKKVIKELCDAWDEYTLLPQHSPWLKLASHPPQVEVRLATVRVQKFYSLPSQDVVLLPCDNISCENLAALFADQLVTALNRFDWPLKRIEVTIGESPGQEVTVHRHL